VKANQGVCALQRLEFVEHRARFVLRECSLTIEGNCADEPARKPYGKSLRPANFEHSSG
jgi:hypothetical protein